MIQDFNNKRVTVMGLGRFGGGVGVTQWLAAGGAKVVVTDLAPPEKLQTSLDQIADLDVTWQLGGHDERDFRETDLVVVNPAVPDTSPFLQAARAAGVQVTTEINLFVERCPAPCIGVTGSVGKSTVTAMIRHLLNTTLDRYVWMGGNIGRSLLHTLDQIKADDLAVLELSSFQLQRTPAVRWSPHIAVITSITPNHLDWHGDFAAYQAAKLNILRYQDPRRDAVIVQDTPELRQALDELADSVAPASSRCLHRVEAGAARHDTAPHGLPPVWHYKLDGDLPVAAGQDRRLRWEGLKLKVPGRHNRENAAAALTVAHVLGVAAEEASDALASFEALPHRLQQVARRDGVTYCDDSKSTTPAAALTAMAAIESPLLIILGGYDKGSALKQVAQEAARRAKFAACIGTTGPGLAEVIRAAGGEAEGCADLSAAVAACRRRAQPGDTVLLSPACASWDQFPDYRVRGEMFARLARGEAGSAG